MSDKDLIEKIKDIISKCDIGNLTTVGEDGFPHTRALEDHNPHEDFTFWFATHSSTRKVQEIKSNPKVSIYYYLVKERGYICIKGKAEIKIDEESKKYLWREEWIKYWLDGPFSKEYIPIKITPIQIEYYNMQDNEFTNNGYSPIIIDLKRDKPN